MSISACGSREDTLVLTAILLSSPACGGGVALRKHTSYRGEISAAGLAGSAEYTPVFSAPFRASAFLPGRIALNAFGPSDDLDPAGLVLVWLDEEEGQWYALPAAIDLTRGYICSCGPLHPLCRFSREEAPRRG